MNILRLISQIDPTIGGPAVSAPNSVIAVQREGAQTTLIVGVPDSLPLPGFVTNTLVSLRNAGVRTIPVPIRRTRKLRWRWVISARMTRHIFREVRAHDILHVHSPWIFPSLVATGIASLCGTPVVLTPHEGFTAYDMDRGRLCDRVKKVLKKWYINRAARVLYSSPLEAAASLPFPPDSAVVLYHPVFDETIQDLRPIDDSDKTRPLGFIGRLHPKKNLPVIIRALKYLRNETTLLVAGEGPEEYIRELRALIQHEGLEDRIRFCGFTSGEAKKSFFNAISMLLQPSEFECFGVSVAEALMHRTPVIVSPEVGLAAIVKEYNCGLVVTPDPLAIASAITTLQGPGYAEMCKNAEVAAARLSFHSHGESLIAEYARILQ